MITEDYVSFETAKLLKEKGFDDVCHAFYDKDGIFINFLQFVGNSNFKGVNEEKITFAPTLQMAMKWLREKHDIFIAINMIPDTIQKHYFFKPYVGRKIYNFPLDYSVEFYTTYEEACEAAIKYCLENLI